MLGGCSYHLTKLLFLRAFNLGIMYLQLPLKRLVLNPRLQIDSFPTLMTNPALVKPACTLQLMAEACSKPYCNHQNRQPLPRQREFCDGAAITQRCCQCSLQVEGEHVVIMPI